MIIGINLDDKNRVIVAFPDENNGDIKVDVDETNFSDVIMGLNPYKYENNKLIVDTAKQEYESLENQVLTLEQSLRETNDKVAEALEYKLRDETIPDELQTILDNRESLRSEINSLKSQMDSLI